MIENVPARVNPETGEQFFSPLAVEQLQQIKTILADFYVPVPNTTYNHQFCNYQQL